MDETTKTHIENIRSEDKDAQNAAYTVLMEATESRVPWAYEVWDELVEGLRDHDNHVRAISSQLLCNLAKSDPDRRILRDFDALLNVTRDEKFVTARHCLQSLWKIGVVGEAQRERLMAGYETRYHECIDEKNTTLIRFDIIQGMRNLYDAVQDEIVKAKALALIELEDDLKYRKKYAGVWKKA